MINENKDNPSLSAFLIDLDLAVRVQRDRPSGAQDKTGTQPFMAIGQLTGETQSFVHGLELFFWVLFWICIHYNGPNEKGRVVPRFDRWNYADADELATLKLGTISDENMFQRTAKEYFTVYHKPLISHVNRLRRTLFPNGRTLKKEDPVLYSRVKRILREAQKDPNVLAG